MYDESDILTATELNDIEERVENAISLIPQVTNNSAPLYYPYNWENISSLLYSSVGNIENGIQAMGSSYYKPYGWENGKTWQPKMSFSYLDVNRWLKDIGLIEEKIEEESGSWQSGTTSQFNNSQGVRFKDLSLTGNYEQETTTGKNLINPNAPTTSITTNGITVTNNGDGTYTVSGTSTNSGAINLTSSTTTLTSGLPYTNSIEILSGSIGNGVIAVAVKNPDSTTTYNYINLRASILTNTVTPTENKTLQYYQLYWSGTGVTLSFTFRVQLEQSATKTDYEPYTNGASPNPDYPQEVEVVETFNLNPITTTGSFTTKGITITTNQDGSVTLNGTSTGTIYAYVNDGYYSSESHASNGRIKFKANITYALINTKNSNAFFRLRNYTDGTNDTATANNLTKSYTSDKEILLMLNIYSGKTFDNYVVYPMIYEGVSNKSYLLYGNIGIEDTGKNLFNYTEITDGTIVTSDNGKTMLMPVKTSGNGYNPIASKLRLVCPDLVAGDVVYFHMDRSPYDTMKIAYFNGSSTSWNIHTAHTITQEELDGAFTLYANNYNNGETEQVTISNFIISKTNITSASEWEPYKQAVTTIDLQDNFIGKLPNGTKDTLSIDSVGNLTLNKKVGKVVLDGSETWYTNQTSGDYIRFHSGVVKVKTNNVGLSNYFQVRAESYHLGISYYNDSGTWYVWFPTSLASTVADFKTWLSTHNTEVYYELAEPYNVNLGKVDAKILQGTNNIKFLTNIQPTDYSYTYRLAGTHLVPSDTLLPSDSLLPR